MIKEQIEQMKKVSDCAICRQKRHWARECNPDRNKALITIDPTDRNQSTIKSIHSDNGSEFKNSVTELLFAKEKVQHETSAPFCPQQNGRIEREIQSVQNMARTTLKASNLPVELWPEAVATPLYLKNRLPNAHSALTPLERLTNVKPNVKNLHEFGPPVNIIVNDQYLTKWDARTSEGFLVGFTAWQNTFKVYVPTKNRVIESSNVIIGRHSTKYPLEVRSADASAIQVAVQLDSQQACISTKAVATKPKESDGHERKSSSSSENLHQSKSDKSVEPTMRFASDFLVTPTGANTAEKQSTPLCPGGKICTGKRLDAFFENYFGDDYAEISERTYANESIYENDNQSKSHMREPGAQRPGVPPPLPPMLSRHDSCHDYAL